ncbi:MAG: DinB family protein [Saprospiraceae bacterium]|nr:DinB family protein [Saprospiraceae bacterium]
MDLSVLLKDYAAYNSWANDQMVGWLREQDPELLHREMASSFPTLRLTLLHIWTAENIWLNRLQGHSPTRFLSNDFTGDLDALFAGVLHQSSLFRTFLQQQDSVFFDQPNTYTHSSGTTFTHSHTEMVLHCLQHSTYHRGQLVTMARHLGITDVPHTDYLVYVRHTRG